MMSALITSFGTKNKYMLSKIFKKKDEKEHLPLTGEKQIKIVVSASKDGKEYHATFSNLVDFQIWLVDINFI
jgi:hypothetical protein